MNCTDLVRHLPRGNPKARCSRYPLHRKPCNGRKSLQYGYRRPTQNKSRQASDARTKLATVQNRIVSRNSTYTCTRSSTWSDNIIICPSPPPPNFSRTHPSRKHSTWSLHIRCEKRNEWKMKLTIFCKKELSLSKSILKDERT